MRKHEWLRFGWSMRSLLRGIRHSIVPLLCGSSLLFNVTCTLSASDLRWSHPNTPIYQICDKPLDVRDDVDFWGFDYDTNRLVTAEDPSELRMFDAADAFFEFVPDAVV